MDTVFMLLVLSLKQHHVIVLRSSGHYRQQTKIMPMNFEYFMLVLKLLFYLLSSCHCLLFCVFTSVAVT